MTWKGSVYAAPEYICCPSLVTERHALRWPDTGMDAGVTTQTTTQNVATQTAQLLRYPQFSRAEPSPAPAGLRLIRYC